MRLSTSCWTKLAKGSLQDQSAGFSDTRQINLPTKQRVFRVCGQSGFGLEGHLSILGKGVGFSSVIPVTYFPSTTELGIGLDSCPREEEVASFFLEYTLFEFLLGGWAHLLVHTSLMPQLQGIDQWTVRLKTLIKYFTRFRKYNRRARSEANVEQ